MLLLMIQIQLLLLKELAVETRRRSGAAHLQARHAVVEDEGEHADVRA
jgi:hypothetical protein